MVSKTASRKSVAKPRTRRAPKPADKSVFDAIQGLLATLELDELGEVRAALARTHALKLDQVVHDGTGQAAMAVPGISKELREVLDAIQEASDDSTEYVAGLFGAVGDPSQS